MSSINLINAFKNAKILISQSPADKNNIIADYIDLVVKFTNNTNNYIDNSTSTSSTVSIPSTNTIPSDIAIYNNFNNVPNPNQQSQQSQQNIKQSPPKSYIDITKTSNRSIQELASTFNYLK